jgi:hypothetical protein
MFVRFVVQQRLPNMPARQGIFSPAYALLRQTEAFAGAHGLISEHLDWFDKRLLVPEKFNRSKSKGAYRRNPKGLSWFYDNGNEAVVHAIQLSEILELCDGPVDQIRANRIGYVLYQDEFQVIAEPFTDTQT